jgi:hypothetical protein
MVAEEKYVIGEHASKRLEERGITEWQAVAAPSPATSEPASTLEAFDCSEVGINIQLVQFSIFTFREILHAHRSRRDTKKRIDAA